MSTSTRILDGPSIPFQTSFGAVHTLSLHSFFDTLLPSSARANTRLDGILRSFHRKAGSSRRLVARNGRLWGYSRRTPSELDPPRAFHHVRRCVRKLAAVVTSQTPYLSFAHADEDIDSAHDATPRYPDAFFYIRRTQNGATELPTWDDIAVPAAYTQCTDFDDIDAVRPVVPPFAEICNMLTIYIRIITESSAIWRIA